MATIMTHDIIKIPAGTIIKLNGFPFMLVESAEVSGKAENYKLALSQSDTCCESPIHAAASPVMSITSNSSFPSL